MKASKDTIKSINKQNILDSFWGKDEQSKTDIISTTKLSAATVSGLMQELVAEGFLLENRLGESSGGRKPMLYNLNGDLACVLTVRITPKGVLLGAVNLRTEMIYRKSLPCHIRNRETFVDAVQDAIDIMKKAQPQMVQKITAVAYSVPGVMDYTQKHVAYSAALYIENVDLQSLTDACLGEGKAVYAFKDTDALILGEYYKGPRDKKNIAYLLCENGVGLSVINYGKLFRIDNCGMEIGHTVVDLHGKRCKCSSVGCVGTMIGEQPAICRYAELYEAAQKDYLIDATSLNYDDLVNMYFEGDSLVSTVLAEQLEILAVVLVNIVNLFNPEEIILGGPLSRMPQLETTVMQEVKAHALKPFTANLTLLPGDLCTDIPLQGMANYVLIQQFFKTVKI